MLLQTMFSCESFFLQREPLWSTADSEPQHVVVRCLADGLGASGQNQLEFFILARHRLVARGHGGRLSGIRRGELVLVTSETGSTLRRRTYRVVGPGPSKMADVRNERCG